MDGGGDVGLPDIDMLTHVISDNELRISRITLSIVPMSLARRAAA
jgi:hypothetical protein